MENASNRILIISLNPEAEGILGEVGRGRTLAVQLLTAQLSKVGDVKKLTHYFF